MGFPTTNSECSVTQQPILNFSAPAADLERSGHIFSDSVVRVRSSPLLCIWVVIVIVLGFGPDPRPGPGPGPRPGPGPGLVLFLVRVVAASGLTAPGLGSG